MPFVSTKQEKFMYSKHPEIARKWASESKKKGYSESAINEAIKRREKR